MEDGKGVIVARRKGLEIYVVGFFGQGVVF